MERILGAWGLVSCQELVDGVIVDVYGEQPIGQIQYSECGRMSAFLMRRSWLSGADEQRRGDGNFLSYAGRWWVEGDAVLHKLQMASRPTVVSDTLKRYFSFEGEDLVLKATRLGAQYKESFSIKLVWRRGCFPNA